MFFQRYCGGNPNERAQFLKQQQFQLNAGCGYSYYEN